MSSMLESLLGGPIVRQDEKRLEIVRRPPPARPRELFDMFVTMGTTASFDSIKRAIEFEETDPRTLVQAVLGRWPTVAEVAGYAGDYHPWRHFLSLMLSEEFRTTLPRRVFDAFSEKRRVLLVRIPRCAGEHAEQILASYLPFISPNAGDSRYANREALAALLGKQLGRCASSRSLATSLPKLAPFIDPPEVIPVSDDPLHWDLTLPPCRGIDLVFTIVRSPESLALSVVNARVTSMRKAPDASTSQLRFPARKDPGPLPPPADIEGWKSLARTLLPEIPENPVCNALGSGTAQSAIQACSRVPIQIVPLESYPAWARTGYETPAGPPLNVSEPILCPEDLTPADREIITARMAEDAILWERITTCQTAAGLPYVLGPELSKAKPG